MRHLDFLGSRTTAARLRADPHVGGTVNLLFRHFLLLLRPCLSARLLISGRDRSGVARQGRGGRTLDLVRETTRYVKVLLNKNFSSAVLIGMTRLARVS